MKKVEELLQREMTRKQFLLTVLGGIVSILGFSSIVGLFTKSDTTNNEAPGYGMRNYGP